MSDKFLLVVGTRPEVIKMRPVFDALLAQGDDPFWAVIGQSPDLLDHFTFEDKRAYYAGLDTTNYMNKLVGLHTEITRRFPVAFDGDWKAVVVHGDTQTAASSAMIAALHGVPVAHVEAGLRSHTHFPWPEEMNRRLIAQLASLHLAPTMDALVNLEKEGIDAKRIVFTEQTGIDALHAALRWNAKLAPRLIATVNDQHAPRIVVTCHRRENRERIAQLITTLTPLVPDHRVIWPRHPNYGSSANCGPQPVAEAAFPFVAPMSHNQLVGELAIADLVITDSGGVIEEAAELEKPCLIIRDETERPEAIDDGCQLVHRADMTTLHWAIETKLKWGQHHKRSSKGLYGDGKAAERVAAALREIQPS